MRTGKVLFVVVAFAAVLGLVGSAQAAEYPLYAGQDTQVGWVIVSNIGDTVKVTLDTSSSGWCMTETHVEIASSFAEIPTNRGGNPKIGHFEDNVQHSPCTTLHSYEESGYLAGSVFVAAHAVVRTDSMTLNVVSGPNTPIIEVNGVPTDTGTTAVLAKEPFNYPNCASYTETDTAKSVWDNGIGEPAYNSFTAAGADWIWDAPHTLNPRAGDLVVFQETFSVPGVPQAATLLVAADNAFKADLNGAPVGQSISAGPGFSGTLREALDGITPQSGNWEVASQGWSKVELLGLGVVSGDNTLTITAANEYMCSAVASNCVYGADRYRGFNETTKLYTAQIFDDPMPGDGPGVQPCYNPGGLIFLASIDYYLSETAWGDGGNEFDGGSWATYITYQLELAN